MLSDTYIKRIFLNKAQGIQDIKMVLKNNADDLEFIVLVEKRQNILMICANKAWTGGAIRGGAWSQPPESKL